MSDPGDGPPGDPDLDLPPPEFLARLQPYERLLLEVRDTLYEGSWDRFLGDLKARLDGKPYIYKLSQTIARDVAAIERLRGYERQHRVNLARLG